MIAGKQSFGLHRPWRWLVFIFLALGLILVSWEAAQMARKQALNGLQSDAENELRLSAANLTGHLLQHEHLPQLLASRESVKRFLSSPDSQDAMPLNRQLDRFRATTGVSDVYLLNRHADTIAASNWHRPNTFLGENYAFRSYYMDAIAGGEGRFYGLGVHSGDRGYYFSAPVWLDDNSPDAKPEGVMVIKVLLDSIEESWSGQDAELLVTDSDDIIFMSSRPELLMAALHPLSERERQELFGTRRYADEPLGPAGIEVQETLGAQSRVVTFSEGSLAEGRYFSQSQQLDDFGWNMHIIKPLTPVVSAQWFSATFAAGFYGFAVLLGGIGWQRFRLRREREAFAERERRNLAHSRDQLERSVERRTRDLVETNRRLSTEIDERRRAEANLRQTRDELLQAAKLAVLGQLAAGINHELNQPLAAIQAYAENARRFIERRREQDADHNLAQIIELTGRMAEISAQLRQFSRKSSETLGAVSVAACFDYALRLFHSRIDNTGVQVERHWNSEDIQVLADSVRLEQVLVNLIGNALQAMAAVPEPQLILSFTAASDKVTIEVGDNGPGINDDNLERVFEPFFTTKSKGRGLGLGLSISSRIIDDLGGHLRVGNRSGGGALFTITLPLYNLALRVNKADPQETSSNA